MREGYSNRHIYCWSPAPHSGQTWNQAIILQSLTNFLPCHWRNVPISHQLPQVHPVIMNQLWTLFHEIWIQTIRFLSRYLENSHRFCNTSNVEYVDHNNWLIHRQLQGKKQQSWDSKINNYRFMWTQNLGLLILFLHSCNNMYFLSQSSSTFEITYFNWTSALWWAHSDIFMFDTMLTHGFIHC